MADLERWPKNVHLEHYNSVVRYWEKRRILLNVLLLVEAWLSWSISNAFNAGIDEIPGAKITDPGVLWQFVVIFAGLNAIFSMGYVAEFFSKPLRKFWPDPVRTVVMAALCFVCFWALGSRAGTIAKDAAYKKAGIEVGKTEANQTLQHNAIAGRFSVCHRHSSRG